MPAHILTWLRGRMDTVNTHGTHKNPHGCRLVGYSILSNSSTTKNKFYLTGVNVCRTLEIQLSVYIFPAIPQMATGQNGNRADHCHRTSILNVTIMEKLTRQGVDHQWSCVSSNTCRALYLLSAWLPIDTATGTFWSNSFFVPASWCRTEQWQPCV